MRIQLGWRVSWERVATTQPMCKKCADYMRLESQVGLGTQLEIVIYLKPEANGDKIPPEAKREERP